MTQIGTDTIAIGALAGEATPPSDNLEVTVTGPIGSVGTPTPLVTWTHTCDLGCVQTKWIVTIREGNDTVATSGWISSTAQQWQIPIKLSAGKSYQAQVTIETSTPSTGGGNSNFTVETPDLADSITRPFLRHTVVLRTEKRLR